MFIPGTVSISMAVLTRPLRTKCSSIYVVFAKTVCAFVVCCSLSQPVSPSVLIFIPFTLSVFLRVFALYFCMSFWQGQPSGFTLHFGLRSLFVFSQCGVSH